MLAAYLIELPFTNLITRHMNIVTIELKDKIIEHIINTRNGAHFVFEGNQSEELFEINESLLFSFLKELESLGYLRSLSAMSSGATGFTLSSLDTFYLHGGFEKHYSLKNLIEDKLLFEVSQLLKDAEKKEKKDIIAKIKELMPILTSAVTLIDKSTSLGN